MLRVSLFDDMFLCTDAEVERMIPLVPMPRREQALSFKFTFGRFSSLKAFLMLKELLQSEFGVTEFSIAYSEHGKPYLKEYPDIHFNISHCPKAIAVAVSDQPVGIDVERFHKADQALLERCMNEQERDRIAHADSVEQEFTILWTCKEAVCKLIGTGITDELHDILTPHTITTTQINGSKGYVLTVAQYNSQDN